MNRYGLSTQSTQSGPLVITRDRYLRIGIETLVRGLDKKKWYPGSRNAIFIDIESLNFIHEPGIILNYAVANQCPVIFICSHGEMSMVFRGRFPHLDSREKLSVWQERLRPLLSPDLPLYYLNEINEFLSFKKLGPVRLKIITLINQGYMFDIIARKLCLPQKSLYRYINGLVSYFEVKNSSFLFSILRERFPPHYFSSPFKEYTKNKPNQSSGNLQLIA